MECLKTQSVGTAKPPSGDEDTNPRPAARTKFPRGFLLGAATSAHQVEGNNRLNDWWHAELSGQLPYRSGDACRHFERYSEDFDLARTLGHNCHRFSIEWSRIEPKAGHWDEAAMTHYVRVVEALKERGLEPVVTLNHFTLPQWLSARGGWAHENSPVLFERYAAHVLKHLGASVHYWLTINEPTVLILQGYINGEWPPFASKAWVSAYRAMRNMARAHCRAYDAVKAQHPDSKVSFAHNALLMEPCDEKRVRDRFATTCRNWVYNRFFYRLLGGATGGKLDFVALNYYTRCAVRSQGLGLKAVLGQACKLHHHHEQGGMSAIGWEVYPRGLGITLREYARWKLPLMITENGIATDSEPQRLNYFNTHLAEVAKAVADGVPLLGYLYWSLFDNFEWSEGRDPHFGLAAVDYDTQTRSLRDTGHAYAAVCQASRSATTDLADVQL